MNKYLGQKENCLELYNEIIKNIDDFEQYRISYESSEGVVVLYNFINNLALSLSALEKQMQIFYDEIQQIHIDIDGRNFYVRALRDFSYSFDIIKDWLNHWKNDVALYMLSLDFHYEKNTKLKYPMITPKNISKKDSCVFAIHFDINSKTYILKLPVLLATNLNAYHSDTIDPILEVEYVNDGSVKYRVGISEKDGMINEFQTINSSNLYYSDMKKFVDEEMEFFFTSRHMKNENDYF